MASDLYSVQETIEQQQRDFTVHRFQNDLANKKQIHQESATYYGNHFTNIQSTHSRLQSKTTLMKPQRERQVTTQLR